MGNTTSDNYKYAFNGEVYNGLDVYTLPKEKLEQLQNKLRILSGQYGILKPLDLMQPYRLEMGTKLKVGSKENLYKFWDKKVTEALNTEMENDEVFYDPNTETQTLADTRKLIFRRVKRLFAYHFLPLEDVFNNPSMANENINAHNNISQALPQIHERK